MINRLTEQAGLSNGQQHVADGLEPNPIADVVADQAKQLQKRAEHLIKSHPVALLSLAMVAGLAVGWWVKRK